MKKREKKLHLSKETIKDLEVSKINLRQVLGGTGDELEPCTTSGSSHAPHYCP